MAVVLFPSTPVSTVREVILVAGPVSRNTRAAPGLIPFMINAAATGVEAVAQIYMGIPITSIINIEPRPPANEN